ncbi:Abieta-7,13-dien-18-ol hydroxylase protein [Dioscorea alata]|uniref:Abieta-7,13-dien-18-ol hydroxylase protein n=1 Tax=Dioscorea alata TaxID=55571 RepID=A0ACB7WUG0_DIOAL|nr:Abieta-7,13-dien-18-ol hydroxylase protein [Dioscorea alata]
MAVELVTRTLIPFTIYSLFFLFALIFLFITSSIASIFIVFIKESLRNSGQAPIFGTIFDLLINFNSLLDYHLNNARKNPTFRFLRSSHSEIFTADPVIVEYILKGSFTKYNKGKYNHEIMYDLFGDGIFAVDGEKWRHQRKLASYEFSTRVLRDFSSVVFRSNAAKFSKKISDVARDGTMIDIQDWLMKSTLDSIFKVGFGVDLDTLSGSNEQGTRFSKAFDDSNFIIFHRYVDLFWEVKRYLNIGLEAQLKRNLKVIDDFVFQLIHSKRELMNTGFERSKEDILSRFLMASIEDPENMTDKYLRDIILNFLIAGKDTSANTLTWLFYMLCKHPFVQEKIAMEIKEVTAMPEDQNIEEFAECLTDEVLDKMHYLHAALTETLRLYPAVPLDGKSAEEDDVLPNGMKVKKGDGISYMAYAMGRLTEIWGENAEEFMPERWLDNGKFLPQSSFKFVAFHAGPRICLGKEFAYRQMKILAAVLIFFFRFKLGDESYIARYRTMFTLHMDKGLHLLAFHRSCP